MMRRETFSFTLRMETDGSFVVHHISKNSERLLGYLAQVAILLQQFSGHLNQGPPGRVTCSLEAMRACRHSATNEIATQNWPARRGETKIKRINTCDEILLKFTSEQSILMGHI